MNIRDVVAGTILGMVISTPAVQKKMNKMIYRLQENLKENFLIDNEEKEEVPNE